MRVVSRTVAVAIIKLLECLLCVVLWFGVLYCLACALLMLMCIDKVGFLCGAVFVLGMPIECFTVVSVTANN